MDLSTYTTANLIDTIADDRWSVRDEAAKRSEKIAAKIGRAKQQLAKLEAEAAQIERVFKLAVAAEG